LVDTGKNLVGSDTLYLRLAGLDAPSGTKTSISPSSFSLNILFHLAYFDGICMYVLHR
jgi:hypothetical protein